MKKHPFLMAMLVLGAIFVFFLAVVFSVGHLSGGGSGLSLGKKVAVVEVLGVIAGSQNIIEQLNDFAEEESVKALVLRVDSPGGAVGPSQEIYAEVRKIAETKPVVVSMGAVAASGGYYVALPAWKIMANPGTITGSIGVIMEFTNVRQLLDKIGLENRVVKSGEHKDIGSPVRPMTDSEREILQGLIDDVHQQFITAVAAERDLPLETVQTLADGRIYSGRQALEVGLVDELGNLQDAIAAAAQLAGIEGKPRVVYPPDKKLRLMEYLVDEAATGLRRGLEERTGTGIGYLWPGPR